VLSRLFGVIEPAVGHRQKEVVARTQPRVPGGAIKGFDGGGEISLSIKRGPQPAEVFRRGSRDSFGQDDELRDIEVFVGEGQ